MMMTAYSLTVTVTIVFFFINIITVSGIDCPEVFGPDVICPGEVRTFLCTTTNTATIGWSVVEQGIGETEVDFSPVDLPGEVFPMRGNTQAYLVRRQVASNSIGDRTSFLRYSPVLNAVTKVSITCTPMAECNTTVLVYGRDGVDMPSNFLLNVSEGFVTYQWEHLTREMQPELVSHFILTVDAPGLKNQSIQVNDTYFSVPYNSNTSAYTYAGTVRAVSICGDESATLSLNGGTPPPGMTDETPSVNIPNVTIPNNSTPTSPSPIPNRRGRDAGFFIGGLVVGCFVTIMMVVVVIVLILCIRGRKKTEPPQLKEPSEPHTVSIELEEKKSF